MAKNIYLGIDGVSRKIKQPYIGIEGISRKISSGYIGVNGVTRQFYESAPRYTWKRCNITTGTIYYYDTYSNNYGFSYNESAKPYSVVSESYTFNPSNGLFTLGTTLYTHEADNQITVSDGHYFTIDSSKLMYSDDRIYQAVGQIVMKRYYDTGSKSYEWGIDTRYYDFKSYISKTTTGIICGSYIDTVISEDRNAYPDNGQSGSYWYIFNG